jgi:hypothetical protein
MFTLLTFVVDQQFLDINHMVCYTHCSLQLVHRSVSLLDFITDLPLSKGYDVILIVVDCVT